MWQDIRFGLRVWARQPGLTLVVLLTLALGIGANTAIFSVVNAVLLRPFSYPEPERLVRVWGVDEPQAKQAGDAGRNDYGVSDSDFLDWKAQSHAFEELSLYRCGGATLLSGTGAPVQVRLAGVTPDFFPLLGVTPLLGRFGESVPDGRSEERVLVLGESLWRRQFGGDPTVVSYR